MTQDDERDKSKPPHGASGRAAREARLAEALRANLRKRKAQARSRRQREDEPPTQDR